MAWIALTKKMRQLAYEYQKFVTEISRSDTSGTIYNLCRDAGKVSLRSVLILFRILHVETMFGNESEGFLHACISSTSILFFLEV